ncbi:MAG: Tim44/TimA family putative adaptor protein [Proteobacteria bacterium]|nr:Tim44/TimA family putative adaptor protein [Pseudomonadota bacterium]
MGENFQFIDIIFFAMVAAFLVLRLRSVLGRRDGHENKFDDPFKKQQKEQSQESPDENVVPLPDRRDKASRADAEKATEDKPADDDGPLAEDYKKIRALDPSFDPKEFLSGARIAFEVILGAYSSGDAGALKPLLNPEVLANFTKAIRDREQAGETLEDTLVGILSAEINEAFVESRTVNVTVKFVSQQINSTRDENGDVIDGNPNAVIDVTDFWTFARDTKSRDPNWSLVATSSLE